MRRKTVALLCVGLGLMGLCGIQSAVAEEKGAEGIGSDANGDFKLTVLFETDKGEIEIKLFPDKAPITVASFVNLCQRGFYNGLIFHRVIANFMIQGGDPEGSGRGGPGYQFEDEFDSSLRFDRKGILAMANSGPRTNGSQFFITHVPTPHLNDRHTVFGEVIKGQDVVDAIKGKDKMQTLKVSGDVDAFLESQKEKIAEWNAVLDK